MKSNHVCEACNRGVSDSEMQIVEDHVSLVWLCSEVTHLLFLLRSHCAIDLHPFIRSLCSFQFKGKISSNPEAILEAKNDLPGWQQRQKEIKAMIPKQTMVDSIKSKELPALSKQIEEEERKLTVASKEAEEVSLFFDSESLTFRMHSRVDLI